MILLVGRDRGQRRPLNPLTSYQFVLSRELLLPRYYPHRWRHSGFYKIQKQRLFSEFILIFCADDLGTTLIAQFSYCVNAITPIERKMVSLRRRSVHQLHFVSLFCMRSLLCMRSSYLSFCCMRSRSSCGSTL